MLESIIYPLTYERNCEKCVILALFFGKIMVSKCQLQGFTILELIENFTKD